MVDINSEIKAMAIAYKEDMIAIRRQIHQNPELGLEERQTGDLVARTLEDIGIEVTRNIGQTGLVGLIHGRGDGPEKGRTVMLRADMDALAMEELSEAAYASKNKGKMHACGHDAHTAWLLGAAKILYELRHTFKGTIKVVFQPAEEGLGGAKRMISDGVLDNPKVDAVLGAHVWPTIESGKIAVKTGPIMAAPAVFNIKIRGKGGHASTPHLCIDPIAMGCQVYSGLQNIVSRKIDANDPVVLSVTQFNGGTAHNIIPDTVEIRGTVRSFDKKIEKEMPELMEAVIRGIVTAGGGSYEFDYKTYYPAVINHAQATKVFLDAARDMLGEEKLEILEKPNMAGEDFAFYLEKLPGVYFMVGTRNEEKKIVQMLHNPRFDIDEDILPTGASTLARAALEFLSSDKLGI